MDEDIERELALIACIDDAATEEEQEIFMELHEAFRDEI